MAKRKRDIIRDYLAEHPNMTVHELADALGTGFDVGTIRSCFAGLLQEGECILCKSKSFPTRREYRYTLGDRSQATGEYVCTDPIKPSKVTSKEEIAHFLKNANTTILDTFLYKMFDLRDEYVPFEELRRKWRMDTDTVRRLVNTARSYGAEFDTRGTQNTRAIKLISVATPRLHALTNLTNNPSEKGTVTDTSREHLWALALGRKPIS